MSLDLSSALREAADHAPLGTLEPSVLGRRVRHRRAARTAARTAGGVGLAGVLAVTATQTPGLLDRYSRSVPGTSAVTGLPADQVATTLPTADPGAAPGTCGWAVDRPAAASPLELAVALGTYPEETYSAVPVTVEVRVPENVTFRSVIGVVVAKDGVVVATSPDFMSFGATPAGPISMAGGGDLSVAACGGPDATKVLPDGDYVLYAVLPYEGGLALSPGEPLVISGNSRERWCGAHVSVLPRGDDRVGISGSVRGDDSIDLRLTWSGTAEAELLDERVVLVDAADRIVADSDIWAASGESVTGTLPPGQLQSFSVRTSPTSCDEGAALPSGELRAFVVATVAPSSAEGGSGPSTNATAVAELIGTVTVP
ncbi:hypothetical protein ASE38_08850 [Cellulomonas sp. Root930]|nr:hypothetical protein ASE38_08850 [Cellulomonas sp. Root930]